MNTLVDAETPKYSCRCLDVEFPQSEYLIFKVAKNLNDLEIPENCLKISEKLTKNVKKI